MWIGKKCIELRYGPIWSGNRIFFAIIFLWSQWYYCSRTMMVFVCNNIQSLSCACALLGAGPVRAERHPRQRKYCVKCQICFKISQMLRVLSRPLLKYIVHNSQILKRYKTIVSTGADWKKGCVKVFLSILWSESHPIEECKMLDTGLYAEQKSHESYLVTWYMTLVTYWAAAELIRDCWQNQPLQND